MSVLSACRRAAIKLNQTAPTSVFSSDSTFSQELAVIANEAAEGIAVDYDWQALKLYYTFTGDGIATGFPLPANYGRMLVKGHVYSTTSRLPLLNVTDLDQWIELQILVPSGLPGYWSIQSNQFEFIPTRAAGDQVSLYYIDKYYALYADGVTPKPQFDTDDDIFRLDENLLALAITWRWKESKGLEFAQALENYSTKLDQLAGRDKGSRVISTPRRQTRYTARTAYPGPLG